MVEDFDTGKRVLHAAGVTAQTSPERPHLLACDGVFDWGRDPLISFSPTLSRDYQSQRKLFPHGFVEMCPQDADELGMRPGWQVKLTSLRGAAVVPIQVRTDLTPGVLLVPYAFREHVAKVLGVERLTAVKAERA